MKKKPWRLQRQETAYNASTTHSWDFLRLERNGAIPTHSIWNKACYGEGRIIGNLDTVRLDFWKLTLISLVLRH
ncbi:hypothetical protein PanWU01x14_246340 [Parasponia andersonii]|uniref:Uncharacterized protein n=1 Tax=Parasponia andersonii TaxID=3476 RepID=A0A2P5BEN9_PARAD|nr:hypothetical protein PanWU01x14_246340 [Parasponia andersonii]